MNKWTAVQHYLGWNPGKQAKMFHWTIREDGKLPKRVIVSFPDEPTDKDGNGDPERARDVHLIAAAPELLKAAQDIYGFLVYVWSHDSRFRDEWGECEDGVRTREKDGSAFGSHDVQGRPEHLLEEIGEVEMLEERLTDAACHFELPVAPSQPTIIEAPKRRSALGGRMRRR